MKGKLKEVLASTKVPVLVAYAKKPHKVHIASFKCAKTGVSVMTNDSLRPLSPFGGALSKLKDTSKVILSKEEVAAMPVVATCSNPKCGVHLASSPEIAAQIGGATLHCVVCKAEISAVAAKTEQAGEGETDKDADTGAGELEGEGGPSTAEEPAADAEQAEDDDAEGDDTDSDDTEESADGADGMPVGEGDLEGEGGPSTSEEPAADEDDDEVVDMDGDEEDAGDGEDGDEGDLDGAAPGDLSGQPDGSDDPQDDAEEVMEESEELEGEGEHGPTTDFPAEDTDGPGESAGDDDGDDDADEEMDENAPIDEDAAEKAKAEAKAKEQAETAAKLTDVIAHDTASVVNFASEDTDFSLVKASADQFLLLANDQPIGSFKRGLAARDVASLFDSDAGLSKAVGVVIANGPKALERFGFKPLVVRVKVAKAVNQLVAKKTEKASVEVRDQVKNLTAKMDQCLTIASLSLLKGFDKEKVNPIHNAIVAELSACGLGNDAQSIAHRIMRKSGVSFAKLLISEASALLPKSDETRNTLAKTLEKAGFSAQEETASARVTTRLTQTHTPFHGNSTEQAAYASRQGSSEGLAHAKSLVAGH